MSVFGHHDDVVRARGGWVYFIRDSSGRVKIGSSLSPGDRLEELQTAHADRLQLLATMPGGEPLERMIHEQLADGRLSGEWFDAGTPGLRDLVEAAIRKTMLAEEYGWCERCGLSPVQPPRFLYCGDRCATIARREHTRQWKQRQKDRNAA